MKPSHMLHKISISTGKWEGMISHNLFLIAHLNILLRFFPLQNLYHQYCMDIPFWIDRRYVDASRYNSCRTEWRSCSSSTFYGCNCLLKEYIYFFSRLLNNAATSNKMRFVLLSRGSNTSSNTQYFKTPSSADLLYRILDQWYHRGRPPFVTAKVL